MEIELALRAAGQRAVNKRLASAATPPPVSVSSPTRLPPIVRPRENAGSSPGMLPLAGSQVATDIWETGGYTAHALQDKSCRFKNMQSVLPFFS